MKRLFVKCGIALLGVIVLAVAAGAMDQKGGKSMFGLFEGKKVGDAASVIAPEVGAILQVQNAMPPSGTPASLDGDCECRVAELRGHAPDGEWVSESISGQSQHVYILPGTSSRPALAILADPAARMQIWELSNDKTARFLKQRPVLLDANQESWLMYFALEVSCLPNQQFAMAIAYTGPAMKRALYVYTPNSNQFRRIDGIESDKSGPPPFSSFETLTVSADAKLVNYRSGAIRLGPANYAYRHNHILLFSSIHPNGLEVVKLGLNDGNLRDWAMQGKTLWLRTHDKRNQSKDYFWSLDLHRVL